MNMVSFLLGFICGFCLITIIGIISAWKQTKPQRELYKEIIKQTKKKGE